MENIMSAKKLSIEKYRNAYEQAIQSLNQLERAIDWLDDLDEWEKFMYSRNAGVHDLF